MDDDLIRDNPGKESTEISEEDAENLEIPRGYYTKALEDNRLFYNLDNYEKKLVKGIMRGSGPIVMLWLINMKGQHGYEIMTKLHESSPFKDKIKMPSASIIYPKLHQLEEEGLIKGTWENHGKRKVKYYEITPKGSKTLENIRNFFKKSENNLYEDFLIDMMSIKNNRS